MSGATAGAAIAATAATDPAVTPDAPPAADASLGSRGRAGRAVAYATLTLGVLVVAFPIWIALVGSTHDANTLGRGEVPLLPGPLGPQNYAEAWSRGGGRMQIAPAWLMLLNSAVMATLIAVGKIAISLVSAFAVVYFRFPGRLAAFWLIFVTLMLPVEVRLIPTFQVVVSLGMTDSMAGLTIPLIASATATLLFRQFFLTIPDELAEAARMDGAGPLRFLRDVVLPLSRNSVAALFVILFIYGWNQYLWPLLIVSDRSLETIVVGLGKSLGQGDAQNEWNTIMATAVMALLPPVAVVVLMQRWFVRGLTETEK